MTQPSQLPSVDDILNGGGARAAEFHEDGDEVGGKIVGVPVAYHVREYDAMNPGKGDLAYWPSGDPQVGIRIDVETSLRTDNEDDGIRRLYVGKTRQLNAVRDAVRRAGVEGLQPNGFLWLKRTGTEKGAGTIPAITWSARYQPPGVAVPGNAPGNGAPQAFQQTQRSAPYATFEQTHGAHAVPEPAPVAAPQAAPAPANVITETVAAAMRNAGIPLDKFTIVPG